MASRVLRSQGEGSTAIWGVVGRGGFTVHASSDIADIISVSSWDSYRPGGGAVAGRGEHVAHNRHTRSIPVREIEREGGGTVAGILEHSAHTRHTGSIPVGEVTDRPGGGAVAGRGEHEDHTRHARGVPAR